MISSTSPLPLLVLAGGFGTRLQSVLDGSPKALALVQGKPFLSFQIDHWVKQGVESFIFMLHYRADAVIEFLKSEENKLLKNCNVHCVIEPNLMGTGGAVANAVQQLDLEGDFLLTNADTWIGSGMGEMMRANSPSLLVVMAENIGRYGEVIFNDQKIITAFVEKNNQSSSGWINAGISRMNANIFKNWNGKPYALEKFLYPNLVKNHVLYAINHDTDFIDIGIPDDYLRFCRWIESGKKNRL
jgi:D-glycero-alpha-D-manno-heptose 1-phosphate guanylyltransferase